MVAQIQNQSVIPVMPYIYKYGFVIYPDYADEVIANSKRLFITGGQCRDSNNAIDIAVDELSSPNDLAFLSFDSFTPSNFLNKFPLMVDGSINGANGLDTGTLEPGEMYAVYVIASSRNINPVATLLSLASNQGSPKMPAGYDSSRVIGYWATDSDELFIPGFYSGFNNALTFQYATPENVLTAGNSTNYVDVPLESAVPPISGAIANLQFVFNADAAGNSFFLNNITDTSLQDRFQFSAPVPGSTALSYGNANIVCAREITNPSTLFVFYQVSSSSDSVNINVSGFTVSV